MDKKFASVILKGLNTLNLWQILLRSVIGINVFIPLARSVHQSQLVSMQFLTSDQFASRQLRPVHFYPAMLTLWKLLVENCILEKLGVKSVSKLHLCIHLIYKIKSSPNISVLRHYSSFVWFEQNDFIHFKRNFSSCP